MFAVHLVFKHCLFPNLPKDVTISPVSIVTALVDRIHVHGKLFPDQDVKISGHVSNISVQFLDLFKQASLFFRLPGLDQVQLNLP